MFSGHFGWARQALAVAAGLLVAAGAQALELRIGNVQVDDSPAGRGTLKFAEEVKKKSGGAITVTVLNGGKAGSDTEMVNKVASGSLEMMAASSPLFAAQAKEMTLWDTPFLFANYKEADTVLDGPLGRRTLQALEPKGFVGLAFWENGFRNLTNSVRPVTRAEDLKDLRLRVQQSETSINMFKTFGADVKPMPWPDVYPALKNKTMDAQENPLPVILSAKLYEVQNYLTLTRHNYTPFLVVASKKWWGTLSPQDQKIIQDAAFETRLFQRQDSRKMAEQAQSELQAKGMKVSDLTVGERSRIANRMEKVNAVIATNVGMPLWLDTMKELEHIRSARTPRGR